MAELKKKLPIGIEFFKDMRTKGFYYVDKTGFIREWWERDDDVTLITRPGRFGKTLTMSMVEKFFSVDYKGREDLFQGLKIWEDEEYRQLQGTYPVIFLSFADVKVWIMWQFRLSEHWLNICITIMEKSDYPVG